MSNEFGGHWQMLRSSWKWHQIRKRFYVLLWRRVTNTVFCHLIWTNSKEFLFLPRSCDWLLAHSPQHLGREQKLTAQLIRAGRDRGQWSSHCWSNDRTSHWEQSNVEEPSSWQFTSKYEFQCWCIKLTLALRVKTQRYFTKYMKCCVLWNVVVFWPSRPP